jgi:hypothetical protein
MPDNRPMIPHTKSRSIIAKPADVRILLTLGTSGKSLAELVPIGLVLPNTLQINELSEEPLLAA